MPTIMVNILLQLPETTVCGNFETMSVRSNTAVFNFWEIKYPTFGSLI
jgi:hypothetical protein